MSVTGLMEAVFDLIRARQILCLGSTFCIDKVTVCDIPVLSVSIRVNDSTRILGVIVDSRLSMADHVLSLCWSVYYQLQQLWLVVRSITEDAAKMVAHAIISSRLDYCNSLLCGIAGNLLQKLQSVQNATADWSCELEDGSISHQFCGFQVTITSHSALVTSSTAYWFQNGCSCVQGVTRPASTVPGWRLSALGRHWPPITASDLLMSWRVPQREHVRVSETGVFPLLDRLFGTLYLSHYLTETSHMNSLRDFWRHFGLYRAAAHSDWCFFCAVYKYSYLLTNFLPKTVTWKQTGRDSNPQRQ